MKDQGIDKALIKHIDTSDKSNKNVFGWRKMFWDYLKKLNVPFFDKCCPTAGDEGFVPTRYDVGNETPQYYDPVTNSWIDYSSGGEGMFLLTQEATDNTDAINKGYAQGSLYKLPYSVEDDIYPVAVVGAAYTPPIPNFDVTADWTLTFDSNGDPYPITDAATFTQWLKDGFDGNGNHGGSQNDGTSVTVTNFSLISGRLRCNVVADNTALALSTLDVIDIVAISGFSLLETLDLSNNQIVTFDPSIALPSSLQTLNLYGNQITTFNPSIALPSSLKYLDLSNNQITTFNPSIALPASLETLDLSNNQITTFNPSIALPSSLQTLNLYGNQITTFNPSIAPAGLEYLGLYDNQIVTAGVNTVLEYFDGITKSSPFMLYLYSQTPPAPPSGSGATAKTNLIGRGCTVTTD